MEISKNHRAKISVRANVRMFKIMRTPVKVVVRTLQDVRQLSNPVQPMNIDKLESRQNTF